jgi:hypothetical protein
MTAFCRLRCALHKQVTFSVMLACCQPLHWSPVQHAVQHRVQSIPAVSVMVSSQVHDNH